MKTKTYKTTPLNDIQSTFTDFDWHYSWLNTMQFKTKYQDIAVNEDDYADFMMKAISQERTQAKREVIEAILKKKKSLVHEYTLDNGWTHEIDGKIEIILIEDIEQELKANTN